MADYTKEALDNRQMKLAMASKKKGESESGGLLDGVFGLFGDSKKPEAPAAEPTPGKTPHGVTRDGWKSFQDGYPGNEKKK